MQLQHRELFNVVFIRKINIGENEAPINPCAVLFRSRGKHLKLKHRRALLYRTLSPHWGVSRSSGLQLILACRTQATKSRSMITRTLSPSMASPLRMTLMQRSKWSHTPLDSTRTSMATSVLYLFITWMHVLSSFKWALTHHAMLSIKTQHAIRLSPFMVVLNLWWCDVVMPCECLTVSHIVSYLSLVLDTRWCLLVVSLGRSVRYVPAAWGFQESLTGRETPATARPTPPSPTAAMTGSEDSCPLPVRKLAFHFQLKSRKTWKVGWFMWMMINQGTKSSNQICDMFLKT